MPRALAELLAEQGMPTSLAADLELPVDVCEAGLSELRVKDVPDGKTARLRSQLARLVDRNLRQLGTLRLFQLAYSVDFTELWPLLSVRATNALRIAEHELGIDALLIMTVADFAERRNVGMTTLLEIWCASETVYGRTERCRTARVAERDLTPPVKSGPAQVAARMPVGPRILFEVLSDQLLEEHACQMARLDRRTSLGQLAGRFADEFDCTTQATLRRCLARTLWDNIDAFHRLPVFPRPVPQGLGWLRPLLSVRASNALQSAQYTLAYEEFAQLSIPELSALDGVGELTLLEVLTAVEVGQGLASEAECRADGQKGGGLEATASPVARPEAVALPADPALSERRGRLETLRLRVLAAPWRAALSRNDPRVSALFDRRTASLDGALAMLSTHSVPLTEQRLAAVEKLFDELARTASEIESMPLEDVGLHFIRCCLEGRPWAASRADVARIEAVQSTLHWHGRRRRAMLEEAGAKLGLTRERLRQIEVKVTRVLKGSKPYLPALDRGVAAVAADLPLAAAAASRLLVERGIARGSFDLASLAAFAATTGRHLPFDVIALEDDVIAVQKGRQESYHATVKQARKLSLAAGATTAEQVRLSLEACGHNLSVTEVERVIAHAAAGAYLDDAGHWFSLAPTESVVSRVGKKMFAVARSVSLREFARGLHRHLRLSDSVAPIPGYSRQPPPMAVLERLLPLTGICDVSANSVCHSGLALEPAKVLSNAEFQIVQAFAGAGRQAFQAGDAIEWCVDTGITEATVAHVLTYSPVIQRVDRNHFSVVGHAVLAPPGPRSRTEADGYQVVDGRVELNGDISLTVRVPDLRRARSPVFYLPNYLRQFAASGIRALVGPDGEALGTVDVTADKRLVLTKAQLARIAKGAGEHLRVRLSGDHKHASIDRV